MPKSTILSFLSVCKKLTKKTIYSYFGDGVNRHGAALAYYTIFSLPASIIIIISAAGFFMDGSIIESEVFHQISRVVGRDVANQIQIAVGNFIVEEKNYFASLVGISLLFFGATGGFYVLQEALNKIFGVYAIRKKKIIEMVVDRILAFVALLSIGLLVFATTILNAFLSNFYDLIIQEFPSYADYFLFTFHRGFSFLLLTLFFYFLFKVLPNVKLQWSYTLLWAVLTTVFFWFGKIMMEWYFSHSSQWSAYGAAGSVVAILLWVYYSSQIVFLVAEFIKVLAEHNGHTIVHRDLGRKFWDHITDILGDVQKANKDNE